MMMVWGRGLGVWRLALGLRWEVMMVVGVVSGQIHRLFCFKGGREVLRSIIMGVILRSKKDRSVPGKSYGAGSHKVR
jgi:hypothetical protein